MKPAPFEHARPATLADAISALAAAGGSARVLAGGQSLGPMLNLRLAQPRLLVQVRHLPELAGVTADDDAVTIGACVTHAAIADGLVPDIGGNVLARVAGNIAYRAVRNRGTIGGSLCHADPAADWVTVQRPSTPSPCCKAPMVREA
jgi:carbon-monoxide dehydrogenase medium subunit